jgi:hypothetical protein
MKIKGTVSLDSCMFVWLSLEMKYFFRLNVKSSWLNNVQKLLIFRVFLTECDVIVLVILQYLGVDIYIKLSRSLQPMESKSC